MRTSATTAESSLAGAFAAVAGAFLPGPKLSRFLRQRAQKAFWGGWRRLNLHPPGDSVVGTSGATAEHVLAGAFAAAAGASLPGPHLPLRPRRRRQKVFGSRSARCSTSRRPELRGSEPRGLATCRLGDLPPGSAADANLPPTWRPMTRASASPARPSSQVPLGGPRDRPLSPSLRSPRGLRARAPAQHRASTPRPSGRRPHPRSSPGC